ncbi:MAG TPA: SMC-Scp complex subunit ScpB [Candidatus Paceibacterota bacterium]|nr:SMC-Scp complex subunit ScpB [Candidatus Paceibacterota bacterium]
MLTPPQALEALLFAAGEPLEKKEAAKLLGIKPEQLSRVVEALSGELAGRGVALVESANELELRTSPAAADYAKKLRESELSRDLGKAGLETLAVIAYRGGATRSEVDWVRGVNSSASMKTLLLRGLIEGREDEADRRRVRYTLTTDALAYLGLARASELPRYGELAEGAGALIAAEAAAAAETPAP